jgi:quercetin dioxygenase-like cupin family protein
MTSSAQAARTMWFLDNTVTIHHEPSEDEAFSVIEITGGPGNTVPLHLHDEDEVFTVLDGELTVRVGDDTVVLEAGRSAAAPLGVPHAYAVTSETPARWLAVTTPGRFDAFVASLVRPAETDGLPTPSGPPSEREQAQLAALAAEHGIVILGPPPFGG